MAIKAKAKAAPKAKGKAAPVKAPEAEKRDNRYLRASRIIIAEGEGLDLAELAVRAEMSVSTAGHCREAFLGVTQALREAKVLPQRRAAKAAEAPQETPTAAEAA